MCPAPFPPFSDLKVYNGFWLLFSFGFYVWTIDIDREYINPKYDILVCGLFWAEGSQDLSDSRNTFTSPLIAKENLDRALGPERELLPEITFYLNDLCAWHGKHLMTPHLLFLSSCESPSSPLKPQVSVSFFSSGWHLPNLSYGTPVCM